MEFLPDILILLFLATYAYTIVSSVLVVLLENRHPVRTSAWIVVLLFVPFVGLFLYIVFGRSFHRQATISKKLKKKILSYTPEIPLLEACGNDAICDKNQRLIQLLKNNTNAGIFTHNTVDIFTDGKVLFETMMQEIEGASKHIHAEYYAVETDDTGNMFKDMLIKKAQQGLEVRLIYDDVGSWRLKRSTIQEMKDAGVILQSFFELRFPYFTNKLNYRNHRKILVIDGKVGFLGGVNIADRYTKGLEWGVWRDTHMRIQGDAVGGLQQLFLNDWLYITKKAIHNKKYFPLHECEEKMPMQIVGSGPDSIWEGIMQGFCHAIHNATKTVYVQTPYFLPNDSVSNALQSAALSGVDVRIMIPSRSDTQISLQASLSFVRDMLAAGIRVYQYTAGFIHAKTITIDDEIAIIGSANMDFRSFEQNFEVSAFMYSTQKSIELRTIFLHDMTQCKRLLYTQWKQRSATSKLKQSSARLFSPLL
ncbi:MAG: cardiolipin synthase [Paludibacteraceae bacterium]|nr:cardiolipin synthase [Paludibacteraceae bacterium]